MNESARRPQLALADSIDGIVWEADADLAFTFVSPQAEEVLGFPVADWLGDPAFGWSRFEPEVRARVHRLALSQEPRTAVDAFECRMVDADGHVHWFKHFVVAEAPNGHQRRLHGTLVDITEMKESERRLRRSEENYRQIVETAEEGIWRIDAKVRTTFVNRAMAEMLGYTPQEMIGRSVLDFTDEEGREQTARNMERRRHGIRERHEFAFRHKDGSKVWTVLSTNPLYDEAGAFCGALAVASNVSTQRRTNALLNAQRQIFEILVRGGPDSRTRALDTLIHAIEQCVEGVIGSVLLLDEGGKRLLFGAGSRLPASYSSAIHGAQIGPSEGSCGSAAFRNALVITVDIHTDPRWEKYRALADQHGLRACWSSPVCDSSGKVVGTFAMYFREPREPTHDELRLVRDATAAAALAIEHAKTVDSLARSVSLLNATIEATADGLLVSDQKGTIQRYNQRFLELWRIPESLAAERDDERLLAFVRDQLVDPGWFLARVHELYSLTAVDPDAETFDILIFKDGRVFERTSRVQRLGSEVIGRVWSFRDVSAREHALRALRESEQRFRTLAEAAFEGISMHEGGVIKLANEGMARMFGYELSELIGMNVLDLAAPEARAKVIESLRAEGNQFYDAIGIRKDGSRFYGEIRSRPAQYEGRPVRVVSVRDVSDRKNLEREREQRLAQERHARLEAERLVKLHDDFLAIASHELKTPLTPLKIYLQLLRRALKDVALPASRQTELLLDALNNTDREYNRLLSLIDDLLDVSRITAGRLLLKRERCDLARIVQDTVARFGPEFERAGCHVTMTVAFGTEGEWDRSRIEQVVTNLISNAMKYGAGKPIEIHVAKEQGVARLTVRDHGIGIAREDQDKIFDRFGRVAPIQHYGGLGLGLFIVRQIMIAHGGTITVASDLGMGATFVVDLPLNAPAERANP